MIFFNLDLVKHSLRPEPPLQREKRPRLFVINIKEGGIQVNAAFKEFQKVSVQADQRLRRRCCSAKAATPKTANPVGSGIVA